MLNERREMGEEDVLDRSMRNGITYDSVSLCGEPEPSKAVKHRDCDDDGA
jgi:hypothetical protein